MAEDIDLIGLTIEVVAAFVGQNNMRPEDVPAFITSTHAAIAGLSDGTIRGGAADETHVPAVSVRKSLGSRDHLVSMIDGKNYRTLRRHLAAHGLSPEEYRARYNLPASYPMVAPAYSEQRSAMAKQLGLGRKSAPRPAAARKPRGKAAAQEE